MNSRIKFSKLAVCFMVMAVLVLNGMSITAFAGDRQKTVSYDQTYSFTITPSQFPDYMYSAASHVPATYYYNDGTYKGTLSLTYAACSAPISVGNYLKVDIYTTYSGTVYAPDQSKTVSYDQSYTFTITPAQFSDYMNSPRSYVPASYYYNDGTYSGLLNLNYAACSAPIAVGNYLEVRIFTTYTGTVYSK
ncbi:hypothetical protein QA584_03015 [Anaerocolumna sp. AGMB13025]|uniref:hypothetical protein n=1 Tax=Anaerocolumna sp. AGMB13025 TaxID=3039116 RepID=UPI00241CEBF5|nr:hypothetical protein [Anaerocolumna sp. AGMB13025]WFR58048.1 hypothetical protein QA584_03015 [Anaerocolumna sp. AGMB13025]